MNKILLATMAVVVCLLGMSGGQAALRADDAVKEPGTPEAVVRAFLAAIPDREVGKLRDLLAETRTCHITQVADPAAPGIWVETWESWLTWLASVEQQTHVVKTLKVSMVSENLATVVWTGHTEPGKRTYIKAVVVLTRKSGGRWLIVSWTQENNTPAEDAESPN